MREIAQYLYQELEEEYLSIRVREGKPQHLFITRKEVLQHLYHNKRRRSSVHVWK
jgi:hypothetical protein